MIRRQAVIAVISQSGLASGPRRRSAAARVPRVDWRPGIRKVLGEAETGSDEWRQFQCVYTIPETDGAIRSELTIMRPCTLWIDNVRIERMGSDRNAQ